MIQRLYLLNCEFLILILISMQIVYFDIFDYYFIYCICFAYFGQKAYMFVYMLNIIFISISLYS